MLDDYRHADPDEIREQFAAVAKEEGMTPEEGGRWGACVVMARMLRGATSGVGLRMDEQATFQVGELFANFKVTEEGVGPTGTEYPQTMARWLMGDGDLAFIDAFAEGAAIGAMGAGD